MFVSIFEGMVAVTVVWFMLGLLVLTVGADILVRGAVRLAQAARLSSLVIGLTVVAYGTGAPEFAVSVNASAMGQPDVGLGNVVGSNAINILLILGLSALILPLAASWQLIRMDVPVMIGVSVLMWIMALDGGFSRIEGICLVLGLLIYTTWLVRMGRRQTALEAQAAPQDEPTQAPRGARRIIVGVLMFLLGLGGLVLGARWMVDAATEIARVMGISDLLIGLTIVAAGTSMPEIATSVMASVRGERDMAIGNVVGSNIFNILAVLGVSATIASEGVPVSPSIMYFDIPVLVAVAVACLPIFFTGGQISRWEGALFLAYYGAYLAFIVLAATKHQALQPFSAVMIWFVMPMTAMGVLVSVWAHFHSREQKAED